MLESTEPLKLPLQERIGPLEERKEAVSNVGEEGYKAFVRDLKSHIIKGDIIQAVPSQRLRRETVLHPFNAYRCVLFFSLIPPFVDGSWTDVIARIDIFVN